MTKTKGRVEVIHREIDKLKRIITELTEEHSHLVNMSPTDFLAIELHGLLCHANHADGCGWHYEINNGIHDWSRGDHVRWKSKARSSLANLAKGFPDKPEKDLIGIVLTVVGAITR